MAVILLVLMVTVVLLVEYLMRRNRATESVDVKSKQPVIVSDVEGMTMGQGLSYHPLHTWAQVIDIQTAKIGLDDLARRLVGKVDRIVLTMTGIELESG